MLALSFLELIPQVRTVKGADSFNLPTPSSGLPTPASVDVRCQYVFPASEQALALTSRRETAMSFAGGFLMMTALMLLLDVITHRDDS
jgi:hypothetical protein